MILKIPLPNEGTSDSIFWVGNSSGVFSISSAYKLLESSYEVDLEESSSGKVDGSLWKAIWSAKVPHKIRVFAWRAARNILPIKTKLFDRNIIPSFTCDLCNKDPETSSHALLEFSSARLVWGMLQSASC